MLRATFDVLRSAVFSTFVVAVLINSASAAGSLDAEQSHQVLLSRLPLGQVVSSNAGETDRKTLLAIYKQAVADDAAGRHEQARKWYDALQGTQLNTDSAVPSAVNLAVLGRFADARKAFDAIASSGGNPRDVGYAQLWQLWLTARDGGEPAALERTLANASAKVEAANPQQQALADLYAGKGSVEAVYAAIDAMSVTDELFRRDARAEAAFFAGGYLQYVRQDKPSALRLYQRELPQSSVSVERPLLEQVIAALQTVSR
ncbi:hypothetical protein [Pseudomonas schmalbachii]|uniref:Tetratricopeptide repeat protein n=1 Tax=Pseudomonas schmalbachii TaxID=2816993 RepID=A0ABS3TZV0_9PSED|nr:hypothetical protein [Pseudomonas schmalbachii]MBO3278129.1 hypothetical protein [Pseudomonas schmalbachii]